ncbi:MAG: hypothetical protein JSR27_05625 [Proteobacteria bacterium]|nr:hypothetical protein [Pseudomonadota bacterium]
MFIRHFVFVVFAMLTLGTAHAAIFCPGNETELRQALATAAANGEDDDIRLRPGTYYTGGVKFSFNSTQGNSLSISGGWTDTLTLWCSQQSPSASATILDGQNLTAVLDIQAYNFGANSASKTIAVSNLTIRNGYTTTNGESAGLGIGFGYQTLRLERTILASHTQATSGPNIYSNAVTLVGSGDVYVINNAMWDLHSNYANLGIFTVNASQTVYLHNNTLQLQGAGFNALLDSNNGTSFRLVNNAIVGNIFFNSRNANDLIRLWQYFNIGTWGYNTTNRPPAVQSDVGNQKNINPGFISTQDLRPGIGSPLVNAGLNSPFGGSSPVDLDGHPRVDLGVIDVGAWESTRERIFANGFQ